VLQFLSLVRMAGRLGAIGGPSTHSPAPGLNQPSTSPIHSTYPLEPLAPASSCPRPCHLEQSLIPLPAPSAPPPQPQLVIKLSLNTSHLLSPEHLLGACPVEVDDRAAASFADQRRLDEAGRVQGEWSH